jgi:3-hydroxyisobutyrate dehydrogenase-like beta-hydroxyacid dehydrogenase
MTDMIGFIGVGTMGEPMCRNLARKSGLEVLAADRDDAPLKRLAADGVKAASIDEIAESCRTILLSLPGGKQVAEVCAEIAAHAAPGTIVADLSTTARADARDAAATLAKAGLLFADAPVARTRQAAIDGTLSIMVGASPELFARIEPLLRYMGSDVTHCGEVGCGQVVKLVNNTLLFENVAAIAEMMVVAERAGVAPATLIAAVGLGSGNSFALQTHGAKAMAPRDFPAKAFPSTYALKDLDYAVELAAEMGVEPRMATLAAQYYRAAVERGIGEKYFPAIIEVVDDRQD